jgi:rubrerythrin
MSAFMSNNTATKQTLFDFSEIMFRHFTWIENYCIKNGVSYDYERNMIPLKVDNLDAILHDIIARLNRVELQLVVCDDEALSFRISQDIEYFIYTLKNIPSEPVSAFDMQRTINGIELTEEATDALTLFLFEESYKEYELIMIYNYLKAHSKDIELVRIFQILIDESFFHLKRFGQMMADMGILGVPRTIAKELYVVEDIVEFLKNGINEELLAKEECKRLSDAVSNESKELAKFFDFVNYQENYHIALMKEALEFYNKAADVQ